MHDVAVVRAAAAGAPDRREETVALSCPGGAFHQA